VLHPAFRKFKLSTDPKDYVVVARATVPALPLTCIESRYVASLVYHQALASRLLRPVYFDFDQDIIFGDVNTISAREMNSEEMEKTATKTFFKPGKDGVFLPTSGNVR